MKGKVSNHFPGHCKDSKDQVLRKPRLLCFGPNDTFPLFWLASSYQPQDSPAGLSRGDHLLPGLPRQHLSALVTLHLLALGLSFQARPCQSRLAVDRVPTDTALCMSSPQAQLALNT